MKKTFKILSLILCLLLVATAMLTACGDNTHDHDHGKTETVTTDAVDTSTPSADTKPKAPDYSDVDLDKCVTLGKYTGMVVDAKDSTEAVALWEAIVKKCTVTEYPEDAVSYYTEQTKQKYEEYAKKGNMTYSELMAALDMTEDDIVLEAKDLVKKDLVALAISKAEGISLTDKEKTDLFDKYAQVYIDLYGYSYKYVSDNLADEVYASMQHDKMMEYLIKKNFFVVED